MSGLPIPSAFVIAYIVRDALPPSRADVATLFGSEMPRYGVGTELVGQGGGVRAAVAAGSPWPAGGMHVVGRSRSRFAGVCAPLWDLLGLLRALRRRRPDCIQVRDKIASGLACRLVAALLRIPFIYWMSFPIVEGFEVRCADLRQTRGGLAGKLLWAAHALRARASRFVIYKWVLPGTRHIFVQSEAMADWLAAKGLPRARMTAVPMGVDARLFERARIVPAADARLDGRRVVVYLGSVGRARQSAFLLDVVDALRRAMPKVLLVIAGDAPSSDEMAWMRRTIRERALEDHVLLTGWLPQARALGYVIRAEVGLSPIPRGTLFDVSSPTKLVEYLTLGIPSVANDIPDQKLVIEQSGAGLCVPMEAGAFAAATLYLLNNRSAAQQCAERGPAYVGSHRTYAILGRNVANTYKKILTEQG
jgi:glycosyltransferase involved in cell wall biosynthesis